jgi:hypothetical protein
MSCRQTPAYARFDEWAKGLPYLRPEDHAVLADPWIPEASVIQLLLANAIHRLADVLERQGK